jgi:hypothetical protein
MDINFDNLINIDWHDFNEQINKILNYLPKDKKNTYVISFFEKWKVINGL